MTYENLSPKEFERALEAKVFDVVREHQNKQIENNYKLDTYTNQYFEDRLMFFLTVRKEFSEHAEVNPINAYYYTYEQCIQRLQSNENTLANQNDLFDILQAVGEGAFSSLGLAQEDKEEIAQRVKETIAIREQPEVEVHKEYQRNSESVVEQNENMIEEQWPLAKEPPHMRIITNENDKPLFAIEVNELDEVKDSFFPEPEALDQDFEIDEIEVNLTNDNYAYVEAQTEAMDLSDLQNDGSFEASVELPEVPVSDFALNDVTSSYNFISEDFADSAFSTNEENKLNSFGEVTAVTTEKEEMPIFAEVEEVEEIKQEEKSVDSSEKSSSGGLSSFLKRIKNKTQEEAPVYTPEEIAPDPIVDETFIDEELTEEVKVEKPGAPAIPVKDTVHAFLNKSDVIPGGLYANDSSLDEVPEFDYDAALEVSHDNENSKKINFSGFN